METLPLEILTQVIFELGDDEYQAKGTIVRRDGHARTVQLALYSTISRQWNASIERLIFRSIALTTDELDTFEAAFGNANISRRKFLNTLDVTFILPDPPNGISCCDAGQIVDREADSAAFSASVVKLFTALAGLEAPAVDRPSLSLLFYKAHRRSFHLYMASREPLYTTCREKDSSKYHYPPKQQQVKAQLGCYRLVQTDAIPMVRGVTILDLKAMMNDLEDLDPAWLSVIIGKLPDLVKLVVMGQDRYDWGRHKRSARRDHLSRFPRNITGEHLREVTLDIRHQPMLNETIPVHKFVEPNKWNQESWYGMLKKLAELPKLAKLRLHGGFVTCPEFFRGIVEFAGEQPFPALVEFEIQFAPETADGKWFFERDVAALEASRSNPEYAYFWEDEVEEDGYQSSDISDPENDVPTFDEEVLSTGSTTRDRFRSLPSEATLLPFLLEAAAAVSRISNLRKFVLKHGHLYESYSDLNYFPIVSRVFELWYLAAGMPRTPSDYDRHLPYAIYPKVPVDNMYMSQNRLYWRVNHWKPWEEVLDAWSAIAGPGAKVVFLDEDKWSFPYSDRGSETYNGTF